MFLWLILAALAAIALGIVVYPLLRANQAAATRADYDIEVYLDQLQELNRDIIRGVIGEAEGAAARTEIERRLIAAERSRRSTDKQPPSKHRSAFAIAAVLTIAVPAAALFLYSDLGSPNLPGLPFAERPEAPEDALIARAMAEIADAEAAVRADPANPEAWYELGRIRFLARQWQRAADAFAEAMRLAPDRSIFASARGEALVYAADGMVTSQARVDFQRALTSDRQEPRARYYLALADYQDGKEAAALRGFIALLRESPADAPWRREVEARARALATQLGEDPDALLATVTPQQSAEIEPATPPGPDAADIMSAEQMSPEERAAMIRGMVESLAARLEAEAGSVEDWRRLAQSWSVLGEHKKESDAYTRALELAPSHPETLFRGALAASDAGDHAAALDRFRRLQVLIPPDTDAYGAVRRAIERLEAEQSGG